MVDGAQTQLATAREEREASREQVASMTEQIMDLQTREAMLKRWSKGTGMRHLVHALVDWATESPKRHPVWSGAQINFSRRVC